jgi:hypothetical protein
VSFGEYLRKNVFVPKHQKEKNEAGLVQNGNKGGGGGGENVIHAMDAILDLSLVYKKDREDYESLIEREGGRWATTIQDKSRMKKGQVTCRRLPRWGSVPGI